MSDLKGKAKQYDIGAHEDELRRLCDDGEEKVAPEAAGGSGSGEGVRGMKEIDKAIKKLFVRNLESADGQSPKKKQKKTKKTKKQNDKESWASNPSYSFDGSTSGCCLPSLGRRSSSDVKAAKKPSNHQLLLKSIIEKNDFYSMECNVHSR
ncbi:hypothetical protein Cni_G18340 [Canna indica]|uniref:Uncharacterized protein n=1 Tax=Canna indica TaxID=4628 RepID=A0AAQ3KP69_9LILI|nr:hypothetical protein Cni_G18340 [Canna indica]